MKVAHISDLHMLRQKADIFRGTKVEQKNHGYINQENLDILSFQIEKSPAANIGIVMHHQPKNVGTPLVDKFNTINAEILVPFTNKHDRIKLFLFGHVHNDYEIKSDEIIFSSAPATCLQFKKNTIEIDIDYNFGYKEYIFKNNSVHSQTIWLNK